MSGLFKRQASRSGSEPDGPETAPPSTGADAPTAVIPANGSAGSQEPPTEVTPARTEEGVAPAAGGNGEAPAEAAPAAEATPAAPVEATPAAAAAPAAQAAPAPVPAPTTADQTPPPGAPEPAPDPAAPNRAQLPTPAELAAAAQPPAPAPAPPATLRERSRMRRRMRYLRAVREVQFRNLGGLVYELSRFRRRRDDLINRRLESLARTDAEIDALEGALRTSTPIVELRAAGIGGECRRCKRVYGSSDHFCSHCGVDLRAEPELPEPEQPGPEATG